MKLFRMYADTSVYGGCVDEEFQQYSLRFFEEVKRRRLALLVSPVVQGELEAAPELVRAILEQMPSDCTEQIGITEEMLDLCQAYLTAKVLSQKWHDDALHVAIATVAAADAIVTWNFRHIVNFDKILAFNGVSMMHGYRPVHIISPMELSHGEDEEVI